jgi:hypothetical protein
VVKIAVLKTRTEKEHAPTSALHARWRDEAAALCWDGDRLLEHVAAAARQARRHPAPAPSAPGLAAGAVTAAGRRRAVFFRADLTVEVAARLPVSAATAEQVRQAVERLTDAALARPDARTEAPT